MSGVLAVLTLCLAGVTSAQQVSSYAPTYQICPATTIRRGGTPQAGNQTLNNQEAAYVAGRQKLIPASLASYLGSRAATVFGGNISAFPPPVIALSISGGGDRAALYGAGVISALDSRDAAAMATGTGGLLQSATYISALSGGSWFLTSYLSNNAPIIADLVLGNAATGQTGWNLVYDLFTPNTTTGNQQTYISEIMSDLALKSAAGFNVTFGDYWARALSYHYLPGTTQQNFFSNATTSHGTNYTFSTAPLLPVMRDHLFPFPLIVGDVASLNTRFAPLVGAAVPIQNIVYEMTPFEFGSYDPMLQAFVPMNILGTSINNGNPYGNSPGMQCVSGFDNSGFIMGISSNLFNLYNDTNSPTWTSPLSPVNAAWKLINSTFYSVQPTQGLDISAVPNPFQGLSLNTFQDSNETQLRMIDGGLNNEVSPLPPLLVASRGIDTIIVADGSADSATNRPQGASLIATQLREAIFADGTQHIPPLPLSTNTYIAYGLNTKPTFFGCKGTPQKLSGVKTESPYPMMVYLPNFDQSSVTNTSTSQLVYSDAAARAFLDTTHNSTLRLTDPMWSTALACAVVERTRGLAGIDATPACVTQFQRYCWNETEAAVTSTSTNGTSSPTSGASSTAAGTAPTGSTSNLPSGANGGARVGVVGLLLSAALTLVLA